MDFYNKSFGFKAIINLTNKSNLITKWNKNDSNEIFTEVSFSFPDWSNLRGDKYKTLTSLNNSQQELAKKNLQQWADIANIKFIEKNNEYDTDIKFGLFNNVNELINSSYYKLAGIAQFPGNETNPNKKIEKVEDYSQNGQIWINISETNLFRWRKISELTEIQKVRVGNFKEKSDNISTYFEEKNGYISLYKNKNGTAHIENKLSAPEKGTFKEHIYRHEIGHSLGLIHTFSNNVHEPDIEENSLKYSIMSYRYPKPEDADFNNNYPMSPLLIDIYIIQQFYGANMFTRTDDTVYGFYSNSQREHYSLNSPEDNIIACIWDAGGIDTLDFSQYRDDQKLDLNQGNFSDVGGLRSNVSIAYGTIIENAISGSGNDTITGNDIDNYLYGNEGNDILFGHKGSDTLYGGEGSDALYGDEDNDFLYGNSGNDILCGGNGINELTGGEGRDIFIFRFYNESNSYDKIKDFNRNDDFIAFINESGVNLNIRNLISTREVTISLSYQEKDNTTKLILSKQEGLTTPTLKIDILGELSYEDLFF